MRNRGSVVISQGNKVCLIKRVRDNSVYFVFPGGGIEADETPEQAAKREAFEELGVTVELKECLVELEKQGTQYFFLADIIHGTIGSGQGEEFTNSNRDRGTYLPMWVDIDDLTVMDVKPNIVAKKVQEYFARKHSS
ncbi:NUDIX domain-containing protein [Niallia circulans]|uniref:DNA mismatch repair protein MutT n=1 Tax=Niallia circulans TaxID=1397 RepID=A0A268F5S9_NIACI|nr:NUDIX domain-containing protein [Niallia circulans]AYV66956.1 NUDIX domain-containing protein [Niallia circulans]PAD24709.1 DNA mismatch repair protein MutT [Niallia circulans]PAD80720.1 DNA mismatch repair protein MutT [Niallia circulans]